MTASLHLRPHHFKTEPWDWTAAQKYVVNKLNGGEGGQGAVFSCIPAMEGAVAKLYARPRSEVELHRVQQLIEMCSRMDETNAATAEWFRRLNVPMRPIMKDGEFRGVILPPIPNTTNVPEYRFDPEKSRMIKTSGTIRFEAQFLAKKNSVVGPTTEVRQWRVLYSLAETVALMHTANLVHGDLSMNNVLVQSCGEDYTRDHVYLIDVDDAFLDDSSLQLPPAIRKSRLAHDPYSVEKKRISKHTDVFVVALWVVAFMQGRFAQPTAIAREVPRTALDRIRHINPRTAEMVTSALALDDSRPPMVDFYLAILEAARKIGAA